MKSMAPNFLYTDTYTVSYEARFVAYVLLYLEILYFLDIQSQSHATAFLSIEFDQFWEA